MELDRCTTNVLKGIGIILIVFSHLIWHMPAIVRRASEAIASVMGIEQIGVSLFLFASGYGLCKTYGLANVDAKRYLRRRFDHVVIPYWVVLALYAVALTLFIPWYFANPLNRTALVLNSFLVVFSPYDIIGGWFVTYILTWYLLYLIVAKLPRLGETAKMLVLFFGASALIYATAGNPAKAVLIALFPSLNVVGPFTSNIFYLPYVLAFPLGAVASRWGKWQINLHFAPMEVLGRYAYWIYLLHIGLLCSLAVFGFNDFCWNWTYDQGLAYTDRAQQGLSDGNYTATIIYANMMLGLNSADGRTYNIRGAAQMSIGNYSGAIGDFERAIDLDPGYFGSHFNLGMAYWSLQEYSAAVAAFDDAERTGMQSAPLYYNRGASKHKLGMLSEAVKDYEKAIALYPKDSRWYYDAGIAYALLGNHSAALVKFNAAEAMGKSDAELYYARSVTRYNSKDYAGSAADLDNYLLYVPENAEIYKNRGVLEYLMEDYEAARRDYDRAHQLNPAYADYNSSIGGLEETKKAEALKR
ncbi:MAG: tetratricopeptide repeat protein [Candidatus Micrarchaeia archaeon]|jgi:tetratricopeptide (TPR) repeat protein